MRSSTQKNMKPELLVPVGTVESFYAALEGGADAVYLGLKEFNARQRAKNFHINQLQALLKETQRHKIKVYLTLNTLVKNSELPRLLDTLYILSQTNISAVIIQDLGVLYLLKKFFPSLNIHLSTQAAIHNSPGTIYFSKKGIERIILARELTLRELKIIRNKSSIELEVFVHGALCYSFSGMCLFSSFLGGMSANRGLCRQPCRRLYLQESNRDYFFSLKDNQQIENIPHLMDIDGLKIEGRMKPAEYVYRTTKAYRMVIDNPQNINKAKRLLKLDFGRDKTTYFLGKEIENSITQKTFSGILIGKITKIEKDNIIFSSTRKLKKGFRMRIAPKSGKDSQAFKLKEFNELNQNKYQITLENNNFSTGDEVFLIGLNQKNFKNKFPVQGKKLKLKYPKTHVLRNIGSNKKLKNRELYIRIDTVKWLRKIYFSSFDYLILRLSFSDWGKFNLSKRFIQKNIDKLIVEFPKFIPENEITSYRRFAKQIIGYGISNFMLSHISQKMFIPKDKKLNIFTNENVYTLNDATIQFLKSENIFSYVYPLENDFANLQKGKDRKGIVPLHFYPELFYSRMPITELKDKFKDNQEEYIKVNKDGYTIVLPEVPVSLLHYTEKLMKIGFRRFLIDLSYEKPSQNLFNKLIKKFKLSKSIKYYRNFNFRDGLK